MPKKGRMKERGEREQRERVLFFFHRPHSCFSRVHSAHAHNPHMTEKETKKDPKAGMAAPDAKAAAAAAPAPAPAVEGDDLFEEFELPGGARVVNGRGGQGAGGASGARASVCGWRECVWF